MVLWTCRRCTTRFAVGLPYCPQCTSTDIEKEDGVPKITVHGGPSDAAAAGEPPAPAAAAEASEVEQATSEDAAAPDSVAEPVAEVAVPDGTVEAVLAWVGDDPERAQRALDYERAKPTPRTTLVAELEKQAV